MLSRLLPHQFLSNWLHKIRLNWASPCVNKVSETPDLSEFVQLLKLFNDSLGTLKSVQVRLSLKENASPSFHKARPISFAVNKKKNVSDKLDELESQGNIESLK